MLRGVVTISRKPALNLLGRRGFTAAAASTGSTNTTPPPPVTREEIIRKALNYVDEYGWNDECLVRAVKELDLPPLSHRIVTRGASEMVQQILLDKLAYVSKNMNETYPDSISPPEFDVQRLRVAMEHHIDFLKPFHRNWAEALALSLTPAELPHTTQSIFQLSDDLCYFSGIRATRIDWYYERAVVTGLYSGTELFLLTDQSENLQETKLFLDKSLEYYSTARNSPFAFKNIMWSMMSAKK